MSAPGRILELIRLFEDNLVDYQGEKFKEVHARLQFINPMFELMGWDINNQQGYAEAYKDVYHEDTLKIEGSTKAPDYSFRVGGVRKFFLEAKKPSVKIQTDLSSAFQLRRYGWSAKLPISVLTNFEDLVIYDCRIRPQQHDKPNVARIKHYSFRDYAEKWDEITHILSKDAILRGSFDRYADEAKKKRGTIEVDEAFLKEIEGWRDALAHNIPLRNPGISVKQLNSAVQRTIDRIIFLRIAEDRGIEPYGRLSSLTTQKDIYTKLAGFFRAADKRYNSGLFHFRRGDGADETLDTFTLSLVIEDKILKGILKSIYYPDSPYEFSVLPADILGQVYEQFLGKVIRLSGKGAVVEEKPDVKKAGGVYYTPTYIVEDIVQDTLGKLLDGKTLGQVSGTDGRAKSSAPIRVVDPACGSGSFLIVAYQVLLNWYRDKYISAGPQGSAKGKEPRLYQGSGGEWKLTIAERRRILLSHIFGVDIDNQAVEVTKLSLLLKVLEGENGDTLARQMDMFQTRALPDLSENIKCGNSLIGTDFYTQAELPALSDEDHERLNAFDWQDEFRAVFKAGGFDIVIGNPPYIFSRGVRFSEEQKTYYYSKFKQQNYQLNTYPLFIEQGIKILRRGGRFGYITPNNWLTIGTLKGFRNYILSSVGQISITNYGYKVFKGANVDTATVIFTNTEPSRASLFNGSSPNRRQLVAECSQAELLGAEVIDFGQRSAGVSAVLAKLNAAPRLSAQAAVKAGLMAYELGKGSPPQTKKMKEERVYHAERQVDTTYRRYLDGKDVKRYQLVWSGQWLKYGSNLAAPRVSTLYLGERILVRQIPARPPYSIHATLTSDDFVNDRNSMIVVPSHARSAKAILGVLNSKLLSLWFDQTYQKLQRGIFPQFKINELANFPLALTPALEVRISAKVQEMLSVQDKMRNRYDRTLDTRVKSLNGQIDALVCEAFGVTLDEQTILEKVVVGECV